MTMQSIPTHTPTELLDKPGVFAYHEGGCNLVAEVREDGGIAVEGFRGALEWKFYMRDGGPLVQLPENRPVVRVYWLED
jgi:hypothetical protein